MSSSTINTRPASGSLMTDSLSSRAEQAIRDLIAGMDLGKDTKLPREEALAVQLGVSRTTIRQALNNLAAEGVVFRHQGKGTFVNPNYMGIQATFSPCMELMEAIDNSGYEPSVELMSTFAIQDQDVNQLTGGALSARDLRSGLGIDENEALICCDKAFYADKRMCVICRDFFSAEIIGGLEGLNEFEQYEDSVYRFIYGLSGRRTEWDKVELSVATHEEVGAIFAMDKSETHFEVSSVLALHSFNYDQNDKPVLYAMEFFDTSLIKFNLIRQKSIEYQSV